MIDIKEHVAKVKKGQLQSLSKRSGGGLGGP